jgi:hypothetical protein
MDNLSSAVLGGEMEVSLEKALAKTESDADAAFKAATTTVSSLKKFRAAAHSGDLRELRKTIEAADQAITALRQQFANAKEGWDVDEEAYLSGRNFLSEILETAGQMGVKVFEQDDRLYCYPFLIRILPNERTVLIDKAREKRLRPSVLVSHLKDLQNKPVRFKPETFLESLFSAYRTVVAAQGKTLFGSGFVVKLLEIYRLLTLLPGQSKEYSLQEFARDIYLLDQSRVNRTKKGQVVSFPASTGTRSTTNTITVITQNGHEKKYYGISFVNG